MMSVDDRGRRGCQGYSLKKVDVFAKTVFAFSEIKHYFISHLGVNNGIFLYLLKLLILFVQSVIMDGCQMKSRAFTSEMMTGGSFSATEVPSCAFSFGAPGSFVFAAITAAHRIILLHGLAVILPVAVE